MYRYPAILLLTTALTLLGALPALAGGSLSYRARVVHNDRQYVSVVSGAIDFDSYASHEEVEESFLLDWQRMPGSLVATHPMLPAIWQVEGRPAQRFGRSMPHFDNPRLRHFIVANVIAGPQQIAKGAEYLDGQLIIGSTDFGEHGFELVASFRGAPLVIVGSGKKEEGWYRLEDMVVLGPQHELYQYFFEEISRSETAMASPPTLPSYNINDYVTFPENGGSAVAIRPVKDWLVFQATLPGGRPLNLVFDSGAETMILDDMVLKLDAGLEPAGRVIVAGALELGEMELYEGLNFEIGGVQFSDFTVLGAPMTTLGFGADLRIHGIVGAEILQLCQLDLNLKGGELRLLALGAEQPSGSEELPLTFIQELPHVEAEVQDTGRALLLLDTGQRNSLSVNWDWLESYEMDDELRMDGFLGDITGGLLPRYIVEELDLSLGSQTYKEKTVNAGPESTFTYDGLPVVGSIGFQLLARHFGGVTFDYSQRKIFLRDPGTDNVFTGRPEAWDIKAGPMDWSAELPAAADQMTSDEEEAMRRSGSEPRINQATDPRRPQLLPENQGSGGDPRENYSWFEYWERRNARDGNAGVGDFADELGNELSEKAPALSGTGSEEPAAGPETRSAGLAGMLAKALQRSAGQLLSEIFAAGNPEQGEDETDGTAEAGEAEAGGPDKASPLKKGAPRLRFD